MTSLIAEYRYVQNPALAAVSLWRFVFEFENKSNSRRSPPLPLLQIVLPVIFHADMRATVLSTRKSLRAFAAKLSDVQHCKHDVLLSLHDRSFAYRQQTIDALATAIAMNLLSISSDAEVFSVSADKVPDPLPNDVKGILNAAKKLGAWCAALSTSDVASILHIRF